MSGTILLVFALAAAFVVAAKLGLLRAFPDHVTLAPVSFTQLVGVNKSENFTAICNRCNRLTAGIPLHRLDLNPLPNEAELRDRLNPPAAASGPRGARIFSLRER